jgi:hypothetical protein
MENISSCEYNVSPLTEQIFHILWNPEVYQCVAIPLAAVLIDAKPVHGLIVEFFNMRININLPS